MGVLDGKVVLVTGGGNGIGRECALIAAREGARIVVNDLGGSLDGEGASAGPATAVADEIREAGGEAAANTGSITSLAAVEDMVAQAIATFGGLHAVINAAGIVRAGLFHKLTERDWDQVVEVHLRGAFNVTRSTIGLFRDQNDGAFVQFTSPAALYGLMTLANYGAAKAGIMSLSRIIAMEGARYNVRSNCISPVAWTRMTESAPAKDSAAEDRRRVLAETVRADQPARLAVALASPFAAQVSGQIFGVAGEKIELYSQPRPIATVSRGANDRGWTVQSILSEGLPAMEPKFCDLNGPPPAV